ncbi:MAG TPA: PaaI family thioesterase [Thermoanaerobaculia bacterium]|nr:PaaI family thioesterase [Thermoanaerobaculia bacterium]
MSGPRVVADSPYAAALGVEVESADAERALLRLPFREQNANPGGALHGGVAASLAVIGAHAVTRAALGEESGPWHTPALHLAYLAAAIREPVTAEARLLRRGRELCYLDVEVATVGGKPIARGAVAARARMGKPPAQAPLVAGDEGEVFPGPIGERVGQLGFIGGRGITVELMRDGRSRLRMPWRESNGDGAVGGGGTHEGAALALLDTAGAMASWSITGAGPYKASTPAIQAQILAPPPGADLVAYGRVIARDHEMFWSEVEVAEAHGSSVCARGVVLYRIVV